MKERCSLPNWCHNEVRITGSKEDIAALKELMGKKFSFEKIAPIPEALERPDGMVGSTYGTMKVIVNKKTKVFHRAMSGHGKYTIFEAIDLPEECNAAQAVIEGYRPCKVCVVNPNQQRQKCDRPIEEAVALYKEYGSDNVIDWCRKHWGTKWNSSSVLDDYATTFMNVEFDTAWSPPEPIYHALCDLFPDLDIKWHYSETGCQFSGDFDTGVVNAFADPCECDESECYECHPETADI
jgi:hypothetical protein